MRQTDLTNRDAASQEKSKVDKSGPLCRRLAVYSKDGRGPSKSDQSAAENRSAAKFLLPRILRLPVLPRG
jgi:hypothetical protein